MLRRRTTPIRDEPYDGEEGAPRVLIEDHDGAYSWARARELRRAGFEVSVCDGPDAEHAVDCVLLRDGHCDLADQAEVILCNVRAQDGGFELLAALRDGVPGAALLRECDHQQRERAAPRLEGVTVVPFPATRAELVGIVDSVLMG